MDFLGPKFCGAVFILGGIVTVIRGEGGLTLYGSAEGMMARVGGVIMIIFGIMAYRFGMKKKK